MRKTKKTESERECWEETRKVQVVQLWKQKEAIVKESKGENEKERVLGNPSLHDFTVNVILRSDSGLWSGLFYVSGT